MNEIDLKKTPLSEVDLSKIDYEKSYVMDCLRLIKLSYIEKYNTYWSISTYKFRDNGTHWDNDDITLHLFYKEVRECINCRFVYKAPNADACFKCYVNKDHPQWQPKESVKEEKTCENCKHSTKKSKQEPCCSCCLYSDWEANIKATPRNKDIIIKYEDLGDTVKIVKIEGVMNSLNIITHAGDRVYQEYMSGSPCMISRNNGVSVFWKVDRNLVSEFLIAGATCSKQHLFDVVNQMKLSAKRLAELIKESKSVKRIVI